MHICVVRVMNCDVRLFRDDCYISMYTHTYIHSETYANNTNSNI